MSNIAHAFRETVGPLRIDGPIVLEGLVIEPSAAAPIATVYSGIAALNSPIVSIVTLTSADTQAAPLPPSVSFPNGLLVAFTANIAAITAFVSYPEAT